MFKCLRVNELTSTPLTDLTWDQWEVQHHPCCVHMAPQPLISCSSLLKDPLSFFLASCIIVFSDFLVLGFYAPVFHPMRCLSHVFMCRHFFFFFFWLTLCLSFYKVSSLCLVFCLTPPLCCVSAVLEQHNDQVQSLSWKHDGSLLASSCKVMTTVNKKK